MSLRLFPVLAAALITLCLVTGNTAAQRDDTMTDPEAYRVYASILPITFGSGDTDLSRIALLRETRSKFACPRGPIEPEWQSTVESYKRENLRVRSFLPQFDLGLPYVLVSLSNVKTLLVQAGNDGKTSRGGWSGAYTSFPNGKLLAFSAVGFNESKTRAMVTAQYNCGLSRDPSNVEYDCHGGRHIMLVKEEGRWVSAKVPSCAWIV